MKGRIPADPAHCRYCVSERGVLSPEPCDDHKGPNGTRVMYKGYDLYEPSDWVRDVVGGLYTCGRWGAPSNPGDTILILTEVFGYDPRAGFWIREVDPDTKAPIPNGYFSNISERAIDRTYHRWDGRPLKRYPFPSETPTP